MPFITQKCPICGKIAQSEQEYNIKIPDGRASKLYRLKCGHIIGQDSIIETNSPESLVSLDGKKLYPFQCAGTQFILESNARALVADEMGLGKTVQALATLACNVDLMPFIVIPKATLLVQWQHETMRWLGEDCFAQVITSSRDKLIPGAKGYIISYDLIRRMYDYLSEQIKTLEIKTIILDEVQQIKNPDSQRTNYVRNLCQQVPHIIALSGTPIKNNATEYFSILNILEPRLFPRYANYLLNWCDSYWDGYKYRAGGLAHPEQFKERTKHFIIRRERKEVMPELPLISRRFNFSDLSKEVAQEYERYLDEFLEEYDNGPNNNFERESNILAKMSKLRHITGLSKIDPCLDFVTEFLESTDRKLTIFVHHQDVGEVLRLQLTGLMTERGLDAPQTLTSDLSAEARSKAVHAFTDGPARVLIASTLASGEGLNLQACSDCIMLERQWNPANEEQAEGRFIRIGQKAEAVTATYFVAVGTIDEFFSEIIERKREIVNKTLGGEAVAWDQSSIIKELADTLSAKGLRKWRI